MTSTKTYIILLICLSLFAVSCSTTKSSFGVSTIDISTDTTKAKQEIANIRSLENDLFDTSTFVGKENIIIKYRLFNPKSTDKLPLVIVFHSAGRPIGDDNKAQLGVLAKLWVLPEIQKKYPTYVLAPQFSTRSSDYALDKHRNILTSTPRNNLNTALQLIDSLKQSLNIDTTRIYVVGFSMGGSTVINALSARPTLFAAGVSIAGIPQFDNNKQLSKIPIWLIHGIDDTENPIDSDDIFYKEINTNYKTRFWRLKQTTHDNIFLRQILGETIPEWLFKQRKK